MVDEICDLASVMDALQKDIWTVFVTVNGAHLTQVSELQQTKPPQIALSDSNLRPNANCNLGLPVDGSDRIVH